MPERPPSSFIVSRLTRPTYKSLDAERRLAGFPSWVFSRWGPARGTTVTISATGPQARDVVEALAALIANRFGEDE